MLRPADAPLIPLLDRQARRRGFEEFRRFSRFTVLMFLAPAVLTAFTDSDALRAFLFTLAGSMALLVPLVQLAGDAAMLATLRRKGCLDELLVTRTSAGEIVDQVAAWSVLSVLRSGLVVILPVLAGLMLVVPGGHRAEVLAGVLLWVPATALLVWSGSMVVQASLAWSSSQTSLAGVLGATALLVGALALGSGGGARLAGAAGGTALVGLAARRLARTGLERASSRAGEAGARGPARPSRWQALWENPLTFREAVRRRGAGSSQRWLLGLALAGAAWASWFPTGARGPHTGGDPVGILSTLALTTLFVVQPLRASLATVAAIAREREARTLETVALSGLEAREFLDGWATATVLPLLGETLVLAGLIALGLAPDGTVQALAAVPDLLARIAFGAYLGLLVSTLAEKRRDAWGTLFLAWVFGCLVLSVVPGMSVAFVTVVVEGFDLAAVATVASAFLNLACTLGTLAVARAVALSRVRTLFAPQGSTRGPASPRFRALPATMELHER